MKILFPVEVFYPSQAGGPANTVYWLTKHLKRSGHEPIVVSSDKGLRPDVVLNEWQDTDAGRIIYIRTKFLNVPIGQTLSALSQVFRADVVHLSSIFYPAAFLTALFARVLGKKIVWSPRGELSDYSLNYSGKRKKPILWILQTFIGSRATFHSTSIEETEDIKRRFGGDSKVFLIPNYIEVEPVTNVEQQDFLLYIGRFHPKKAIDELIKAAARSEAFITSDRVLKIAGRGKPEHEKALTDLVAELALENRVEFVGHVEGEQKNKLLAEAYFTFMPSHTENFGIVVLESLAQNTPVVASIHTPWESLETERVGFWTGNSVDELSRIIDRVITMETDEYAGYRNRSRKFVLNRFDIGNNFDEWIELYRSLSQQN